MKSFNFEGQHLPRIFKGNWQLAGGHGTITQEQALKDLFTYVEHGVTAFDMGDIYTGAEETLGAFLVAYKQRFGNEAASKLRMHTKFVPDLNALEDLTYEDVRTVIERSLDRLGLDRLHLVQFHWWDFKKGDFIQAARYLDKLRQEGLIETIGLTNFDVEHAQQLLDAGIPIKSNQVQFSLLDPRPFNGMLEFAQKNDVALFSYGTLAGGLLGDARPGSDPTNRSHIKYELMIREAGKEYYELVLNRLASLADKHDTTIANIAIAFVLQTPGVSSVILGPRNAKHINELDQLDLLELSADDYDQLRELTHSVLEKMTEDIYSYERKIDGPHGSIMKYNLNGMRPEQTT